MNKLFIIVGFCFVFSLNGMDSIVISDQESKSFSTHLNMAVGFGEKVIQDNSLPATNPMHTILAQLQKDLSFHYNNDVRKMIADQNLFDSFKKYDDVEKHDFVKFGLAQVRSKAGNVEEAKKFVIRYRLLHAGLNLTAKYPTYSNAWMGEVQKEERINYMKRNEYYPLHEEAVKDYMVMFMYQLLFAPKMDLIKVAD
jgi:hypothetical protein